MLNHTKEYQHVLQVPLKSTRRVSYFLKQVNVFVPFIVVTFNIYRIVTNFRGRYDSFPTCYPAIAEIPLPVSSDLPFQFTEKTLSLTLHCFLS